ncbi:HbrB-domain-containing protein [Tuber magnatum]|uniref:HbrB-domain-containing protein n=1 Tax=Tuber magnatum TaxID=42249 RepID=A0A317SCM5_9PEZI|nr:HbrB-domain-containing protein [Tuber magnatum]
MQALGAGGERKPSFSSAHSSSTSTLISVSTQDLHSQYASFQGYSSSPPAQQKDHSHSHKPHFLRPRRDKDHTFSSSASNSKAISADGSSLYSFGPSSPSSAVFGSSSKADLQKTITGIDIGPRGKGGKGFTGGSSWDDAFLEGFGTSGSVIGQDNAWALLCSRVLVYDLPFPSLPFPTVNQSIPSLHIKRCYDRCSSGQLLDDVRDLLDTGMRALDSTLLTLPDEKLIPKLVEIWGFLFGNILPYFEAVFLPLQQEFKGTGTLSAKESREFFGLLPHFDVRRLRILFSKLQLDFSVSQSDITHNASRMLQCISVLSSVLTEDEAQEAIDELAKTLKHNWLTRGRTGRNRRGFVGTKTMRAVV